MCIIVYQNGVTVFYFGILMFKKIISFLIVFFSDYILNILKLLDLSS